MYAHPYQQSKIKRLALTSKAFKRARGNNDRSALLRFAQRQEIAQGITEAEFDRAWQWTTMLNENFEQAAAEFAIGVTGGF